MGPARRMRPWPQTVTGLLTEHESADAAVTDNRQNRPMVKP